MTKENLTNNGEITDNVKGTDNKDTSVPESIESLPKTGQVEVKMNQIFLYLILLKSRHENAILKFATAYLEGQDDRNVIYESYKKLEDMENYIEILPISINNMLLYGFALDQNAAPQNTVTDDK
jgi:hypothetical protein